MLDCGFWPYPAYKSAKNDSPLPLAGEGLGERGSCSHMNQNRSNPAPLLFAPVKRREKQGRFLSVTVPPAGFDSARALAHVASVTPSFTAKSTPKCDI